MRYLFIGAHPDDIEFSCGGTILRLVDEGHEVYIVVMTSGGASAGSMIFEREAEQRRAFHYAKAEELYMFCYRDGAIKANARTIGKVADIIADIKPHVVFTHYPEDTHQDHRSVASIVKSATRRRCSLAYFDSYSSVNFKSNLFVDVTPYIRKKKEMLKLFKSQITKYEERGVDFVEKAILIPQLNGFECNASYAEGFALDTYKI